MPATVPTNVPDGLGATAGWISVVVVGVVVVGPDPGNDVVGAAIVEGTTPPEACGCRAAVRGVLDTRGQQSAG